MLRMIKNLRNSWKIGGNHVRCVDLLTIQTQLYAADKTILTVAVNVTREEIDDIMKYPPIRPDYPKYNYTNLSLGCSKDFKKFINKLSKSKAISVSEILALGMDMYLKSLPDVDDKE